MTDDIDPLRTRHRPGVRIDPHAATWESTVFTIAVGAAVRYVEVPADQVPAFLDAVDGGRLDADLVAIATTPTGATLDAPGRIRKLAAFDRVVQGALARSERDPLTGQLTEPGWRPRKRRRDDDQSRTQESHGDQAPGNDQPPGSHHVESRPEAQGGPAAPAAASSATTVVAAKVVASTAKTGLWSSPAVVAAAVAAVVVVAVGTIFVVARSGDAQTTAARPTVAESAGPAVSAGPIDTVTSDTATISGPASALTATSAGASGPVAGSATGDPAPASGGSTGGQAGASVVPPVSGNPLAGTYSYVRTVTGNSGNEGFPVGSTESGTLTLTAACDDPTCAVDGGNFGAATPSGSQLRFGGTASEPCVDNPAISVTDSWSVTLDVGATSTIDGLPKVTGMQGVGTLTVSELNGCNAEIKPITWSYDMTRTG